MSEWNWALPGDIRKTLDGFVGKADNLGLLLDKFTPFARYEWDAGKDENRWRLGFVTPYRNKKGVEKLAALEKGDWLRYAVGHSALNEGTKESRSLPFDSNLVKAYQKRWEATCAAYGQFNTWDMLTAAPLIIGLGAEHILDTAITLDRNTGLPFIPGSALKGLARTVALIYLAKQIITNPLPNDLPNLDNWLADGSKWEKLKGKCDLAEAELEKKPNVVRFRKQFGYQEKVGSLIFMDGIYAEEKAPKYAVDIMNVHYKTYYGVKHEAPSDDQKLTPITYLTVAVGQRFRFAVLPRTEADTALVADVREYVKTGLGEDYGIGAKTSQGYGIFKDT